MLRTIALMTALSIAAPAEGQCRRSCAAGEARDPYGCCVARARPRVRRSAQELRPETIAGDESSVLQPDAASELYHFARAWLSRGRALDATNHARAVQYFQLAAGGSLVFLSIAPNDPRAGRMRAVLVQALDGAGLTEEGEREAAALGGPRPEDSQELRRLREFNLTSLAWAHQRIAGRLDNSVYAAPNARARTRYGRAADYYALYVAAFPEAGTSGGARSELANTLMSAGEYVEAGRVLEALADLDATRRDRALLRAVDAYQHALASDVQAGRVVLRIDPPAERTAIEFPAELTRLFDVRERWLTATQTSLDPIWRTHQLENALWLYRYGRWEDAEGRLSVLLTDRCDDGVANNAWTILAIMQPPRETDAHADVCSVRRRAVCSGRPDTPECVALRARRP